VTRARDTADIQDNLGGAVPPFVAGKNVLINGAFDIWQRGTSFTADALYGADRWINSMQTSQATISQITSSLPSGFRYGIKIQRNSGSTSTTLESISQAMETVNSIPLQGQTLVLSFWAKKGANFSDGANQIFVRMYSGTGTDQNAASYGAWTGYTEWHTSGSVTPTTSWTRFFITGTVPSNATQIGIRIGFGPTGTAGADDSMHIAGVQLESGNLATPFSRAASSIGGELALCQRYYFRNNDSSTNFAPVCAAAITANATQSDAYIPLPVTMRTKPSSVDFSNLSIYDYVAASGYTISNVTINSNSSPTIAVASLTFATATSGRFIIVRGNNSASAYLGFSAEL